MANLGAMLAHLVAILAHLGAMLAHLGTILAHLVGPSWSYVGPTWTHFGAYVGPSGLIWTQLEPQQRTSWRATTCCKIQCFVGSGARTGPEPSVMLTLYLRHVFTQVPYLDARLPLDGPILTYVGLVLTHVGRMLAICWRMCALCSPLSVSDFRAKSDRGSGGGRQGVGRRQGREPSVTFICHRRRRRARVLARGLRW